MPAVSYVKLYTYKQEILSYVTVYINVCEGTRYTENGAGGFTWHHISKYIMTYILISLKTTHKADHIHMSLSLSS